MAEELIKHLSAVELGGRRTRGFIFITPPSLIYPVLHCVVSRERRRVNAGHLY